MGKMIDLTNKKFGRLTVITLSKKQANNRREKTAA
jgi:hypothetical protein